MSLRQHITKILKEETNKDYSSLIEKILNKTFVKNHKDIICELSVTRRGDSDEYYVNVYYIGGYKSEYWPRTQAIKQMYDDLSDDIWNMIYDYFGITVYIYVHYTDKCD
jgi:hypothetical protein